MVLSAVLLIQSFEWGNFCIYGYIRRVNAMGGISIVFEQHQFKRSRKHSLGKSTLQSGLSDPYNFMTIEQGQVGTHWVVGTKRICFLFIFKQKVYFCRNPPV